MGLDKAILSGKEYRKQYRRSSLVDKTCRNHGGCPYCEGNRTIKQKRLSIVVRQRLKEDLE